MNSDKIFNIKFGLRKFDAIVCLDANLPSPDLFDSFNGIPILAADGAALKLFSMGIESDYVIGDLDSFNETPDLAKKIKSEIIHIPEQDSNDFEKVLIFAASKSYLNILIIGFHGGVLEHTLNNWSVLIRYSKIMSLCLLDEQRYGIPIDYSILLKTKPSEIISLIPQPKALLSTKGLRWQLDNEILELGLREGARNQAIQDNIELVIHSGALIVFFDARIPFAPEKI